MKILKMSAIAAAVTMSCVSTAQAADLTIPTVNNGHMIEMQNSAL